MKLEKRALIYVASIFLALIITVSAVFTYAYFSKKEIYDGYLSGEVELLFDRLTQDGIDAYQEAMGTEEEYGTDFAPATDKTWGTRDNPYVISDVKHLYNLSELQNIGYFKKMFKIGEDTTSMPYFLVCTPEYEPVLIDGSSFREITAIGTDAFPFIGSVIGVTNTEAPVTITNTTTTSVTSVIHNVNVKGNPANVDVGLFGFVSFLGTPADDGTAFTGTPSVLSNLVLSDIQVKVDSDDKVWGAVTEFVKDIALEGGIHRYSFTELFGLKDAGGNDIYDSVPHENHHIGILAGHVSYSMVDHISVYYSNDDIPAIDLTDKTIVNEVNANYMSATGIIGFIYNLNPKEGDAAGTLVSGSGTNVTDLSYSMVGGGGIIAGDQAGYVLAKNMYEIYRYIKPDGTTITKDETGTVKLADAVDKDGKPLCEKSTRDLPLGLGTQDAGYYFTDGVFTFALSSDKDVLEPTWDGEVDKFSIGSTNREDWINTYADGKKAVAAFLSPITSDKDLLDAKDKPIVILSDAGSSASLMSLYFPSDSATASLTTSFNSAYTTKASEEPLGYGTRDEFGLITTLLSGYDDPTKDEDYYRSTFKKYTDQNMTDDEITALINEIRDVNTDWKVINLGSDKSSGSQLDANLEVFKNQFKISVENEPGEYAYFYNNTPLTRSGNSVVDYYDYLGETEYSGYIYFTTDSSYVNSYTSYTYYWVSREDGSVKQIATGRRNNTLNNVTGSWRGENVYTVNGYQGVAIDLREEEFYDTGNAALRSGNNVYKTTGQSYEFFCKTINDTVYYHSSDESVKGTIEQLGSPTGTTASGKPIYTYGGKQGFLVDRYPTYVFSSKDANGDTNRLRMIEAEFSFIWGLINITEHAIWNGTDNGATTKSNFQYSLISTTNASSLNNDTSAAVKFNIDGSCYIQYTLGNTVQYVGFNGQSFSGMSVQDETTKLRIYVIEATQNINLGNTTFSPASGGHTFNTNQHVLYATLDNNGNTIYEVLALENLPNLGTKADGTPLGVGWNDGNAADGSQMLDGDPTDGDDDLAQKFRTAKGINFGLMLNGLGGSVGTNGLITAPLGPAGVKADIPLSCVAFRVNKSGTQHIRVIISVSVSDYYVGEDSGTDTPNLLGNSTRYFNMWKVNESGSSTLAIFQKENAQERFEIPISHPYGPDATATTEEGAQGFYNNITYNGQTYGMYMNGSRVLVAYEFTVTEMGVYVLGPSGFATDGGDDPDVPMEIVYFSADGVAGSGRDGASGSQIGTIDYVYAYENKIVPVEEMSSTVDGKEDYSTYYPTYCMTYFKTTAKGDDGNFIDVNNELMYVQRYVAQTPVTSSDGYNTDDKVLSTIKFTVQRDMMADIIQYGRPSDNVVTNKQKSQ